MRRSHEIFKNYIKKKKLKYTSQRVSILDIFLGAKRHLTADDLYMLVRKVYPEIGRTTVYRTMKLMCDAGIASEVFLSDRTARYEVKIGHEHHDHLVCIECGKFYEVLDEKIEKLQEKLSRNYDFLALDHRLEIFGICKKCRKKDRTEKGR